MIQKLKVKYGFHTIDATELDFQVHTIKLRFSIKNVNETMRLFFDSLGFKTWFGKNNSIIFMFYTKDYTEFESKTQKVREFLIRCKITKLYEKLSEVTTVTKTHTSVPVDLNF